MFDIVQHTGLLYHVRDPLWTISQARSVVKTGGHLLIETACILDDKEHTFYIRVCVILQEATLFFCFTLLC
ncbi:DUF1698 domain-containing protein [uncultured Brevibacillus sp.]|uniref:DUF1698 domain-containing protein n=1 Tax=uncultured Brevibacillus sp. TaxID=169970 RepID=UPI00338ECDC8